LTIAAADRDGSATQPRLIRGLPTKNSISLGAFAIYLDKYQ
jgi:hypothetical protein